MFLFLSALSEDLPSWFLWMALGLIGALSLGTVALTVAFARKPSQKATESDTEERL